jgi:transposase-like protein
MARVFLRIHSYTGREQRDSSLRRPSELLGILLFSFRTPAMPIRCLSCHSKHIHRSKTRGALEHLLGFLSFRPYRCHTCDYRFFHYSRLSAARHKDADEHSVHVERPITT